MSHKTAATVAHTIGIDTGKNTLHLIGLDDQGAIVSGEDCPRPDRGPARQCAAVDGVNMGNALSSLRELVAHTAFKGLARSDGCARISVKQVAIAPQRAEYR